MSLEKLGQLNDKMAETMKELTDLATTKGKSIVLEIFQPLFGLGIEYAQWNQYTPYFNDGEACEFSANVDDIGLKWPNLDNDDDDWIYTTAPYSIKYYLTNPDNDPERTAKYVDAGLTLEFVSLVETCCKIIAGMLYKNEQLLQMCFGDHVSVTVFPNDIKVEEYDHD